MRDLLNDDYTRIDIDMDPFRKRMKGHTTHKNMFFDVPYMTLVDQEIDPEEGTSISELWVGGCTTGLVLPEGISNVVSLYPWEEYTVEHDLNSSLTVMMYDSDKQFISVEKIISIAEWVNAALKDGPTLVHCQAGLNRSGMIVAASLVLRGWDAESAISHLRAVRSDACLCNPLFERLVYEVEECAL